MLRTFFLEPYLGWRSRSLIEPYFLMELLERVTVLVLRFRSKLGLYRKLFFCAGSRWVTRGCLLRLVDRLKVRFKALSDITSSFGSRLWREADLDYFMAELYVGAMNSLFRFLVTLDFTFDTFGLSGWAEVGFYWIAVLVLLLELLSFLRVCVLSYKSCWSFENWREWAFLVWPQALTCARTGAYILVFLLICKFSWTKGLILFSFLWRSYSYLTFSFTSISYTCSLVWFIQSCPFWFENLPNSKMVLLGS